MFDNPTTFGPMDKMIHLYNGRKEFRAEPLDSVRTIKPYKDGRILVLYDGGGSHICDKIEID